MSDRIPYYNRSDALERHCTCPYMNAGHVEGEGPIVELDGQPMTRTATDPNCNLHGRNPDHDLPEGTF